MRILATSTPWVDLETHRSRVAAQAENSSRHAIVMATYTTTGWGEATFEEGVNFGLLFSEIPIVSYSMYIDGDVLVDTRFPRCGGGVYRWEQNSKGLYRAAYCFAWVETRSPYISTTEPEPEYNIVHHFTFQGQGLKYGAAEQAAAIVE